MSLEGMAECAQLVKQAAHRPDIAFFVVRLLFAEFWREIEGSAYHGLCKFVAGEHFGDPEVSDFDFFVFIHEDVEGFDIPVQNFVLVDVLESNADFDEEPPDFVLLQGPLVLHFEIVVEIAIVAVLHDDVERILFDE